MQVTKGTWRMREQCVPGSLSSSPAREPGNEAKEVREMVTSPHAGVKRVWNVITADNRSFCGQVQLFSVLVILLSVFFKACTGAGPVDVLEVQSSNSNTKVSRVQVHSLSEGPTRVLGVYLTFSQCILILRLSTQ